MPRIVPLEISGYTEFFNNLRDKNPNIIEMCKLIQRTFRHYISYGLSKSKCYYCRNKLNNDDIICIRDGERGGSFGLYSHRWCCVNPSQYINIHINNTNCPFCDSSVITSYKQIKGGIYKQPSFVIERDNDCLRMWHEQCYTVMTYGFPTNREIPIDNSDNSDNSDNRGNCLICNRLVKNNHSRYQLDSAIRGKKGTYIHGECYCLWLNPHLARPSSMIHVNSI